MDILIYNFNHLENIHLYKNNIHQLKIQNKYYKINYNHNNNYLLYRQKMDIQLHILNYILYIQDHIHFNIKVLKLLNEQDMHLYIYDLLNHKTKDKSFHMFIHLKNKVVHIQDNYHYLVQNILYI